MIPLRKNSVTRILMIGSFLSRRSGTQSISEKLALNLIEPALILKLVSFRHNKFLRFLEIIISCLLGQYEKMHIDTFSGQAFRIAEVASLIGWWRRKKVILTFHGGKLPEFFKASPKRVKRVLARADYVQTPSLYLRDFFWEYGIKINYLPNSIDLSRFPYSRKNVKSHTLLWVRAFTEIYNPDLAIRTLDEVLKFFPDTVLTMIGPDKGLLKETKGLISQLGLCSSVNITGPVPNDELFRYYQSHEVFLNTTSYESFGVAVLEAASCGIPVVSAKVGEIPLLYKHGVNLLMVDDFEPKSFAHEVLEIFNSVSYANQLSTNARKLAETFNWIDLKKRWIELLTV